MALPSPPPGRTEPTEGPGGTAAERSAVDELTAAFGGLLSAERRLRCRHDRDPGMFTYAQVRALFALVDGDLTAGQLAREAELNPASITAMLDHLEAQGIVERHRGHEDRRTCVVSLTAKGRQQLAERRGRWRTQLAEGLAGVGEAELGVATRVIAVLADLLEMF